MALLRFSKCRFFTLSLDKYRRILIIIKFTFHWKRPKIKDSKTSVVLIIYNSIIVEQKRKKKRERAVFSLLCKNLWTNIIRLIPWMGQLFTNIGIGQEKKNGIEQKHIICFTWTCSPHGWSSSILTKPDETWSIWTGRRFYHHLSQ